MSPSPGHIVRCAMIVAPVGLGVRTVCMLSCLLPTSLCQPLFAMTKPTGPTVALYLGSYTRLEGSYWKTCSTGGASETAVVIYQAWFRRTAMTANQIQVKQTENGIIDTCTVAHACCF